MYENEIKIINETLGLKLESEVKFHPLRRWRFDFADKERKIAIEIEGGIFSRGRHVRGKGFIADMEKYNTATSMGWRVYRFTPSNILSFLSSGYERGGK